MRYSIIHHDVRERFDLTVAECIVADSISKLSRLGSSGVTHKSNVAIGKFIGFNEITVRRAKEALIAKGLVFEALGGPGTTPLWETANTFHERPPRHNVEPNRQNVEETVQNVEHTISNKDNEYVITRSSEEIPPKNKSTLEGFESFWEIYPKKQNKVGASAEWRRLSSEERKLALTGAKRMAQKKSTNVQYLPMPSNYLHDHRWEDEDAVTNVPKTHRF